MNLKSNIYGVISAVSSVLLFSCGSVSAQTKVLENQDCEVWRRDSVFSTQAVFEQVQGKPALIAELLYESEYQQTFDFLDLSAENINWMIDFATRIGSQEILLELPNACDLRQQRGLVRSNLSKLDMCYWGATKYLLQFTFDSDGNVEQALEQSIYSEFLDSILDDSSKRTVLDGVEESISRSQLAVSEQFNIQVIEVQPNMESIFNSVYFYFHRDILVSRDVVYTRLNFIHNFTDTKMANLSGFFNAGDLSPVCQSETDDDLIFERFLLKTN